LRSIQATGHSVTSSRTGPVGGRSDQRSDLVFHRVHRVPSAFRHGGFTGLRPVNHLPIGQ
jgi:hypothetical protein